jgi:hypothetical protein
MSRTKVEGRQFPDGPLNARMHATHDGGAAAHDQG